MIIVILLFSAVIFLGGCLFAYRTAFYSPKSQRVSPDAPLIGQQYEEVADHIHRMTAVMQKIPYAPVTIQSHDGLTLFGRYYHVRDGAPVEILFHGYRSSPYRDCSGGHALSRKMGFNSIVVDQRAHGDSEGTTITFGVLERQDCLSWANYAAHRFGAQTPIILSGLSMGAATVLMASDLALPESVCCILADSPYSTPAAIIDKVCGDLHYPIPICRPFVKLGAAIFGRFPLNGASAKKSVSSAKVPILLLHGEADHFVPCRMSTEIAAQCLSPVTVCTFPDAGHGLSYMVDPIGYEKAIFHFMQDIPVLRDQINTKFSAQFSE